MACDLDDAWDKINRSILNIQEFNLYSLESEFEETLVIINNLKLNDIIEELFIENLKEYCRKDIVPNFWSHFQTTVNPDKGYHLFTDAVNNLYCVVSKLIPLLNRIKRLRFGKAKTLYGSFELLDSFRVILHGTMLSQIPHNHNVIINNFYDISLRVFCNKNKTSIINENLQCSLCNNDTSLCECDKIIENFHNINRKLIEMGLLERLVMQEVILLIHTQIENYVQETCKSSYDVSHLNDLENWLNTVVLTWLSQIYNSGSTEIRDCLLTDAIAEFQQKLQHFLHETYIKMIIEQLFYIIIEYPESQPIIDDIRVCLPKTNLRQSLTIKLQQTLQHRLLHQGVSTQDILMAYVAAIRALRRLDPTGVLLDTVTEPIRKYLRSREDTVRCVVCSLTEEGSFELADELVKGEPAQLNDSSASDEESDDWQNWMPDPIEADPAKTSKLRRTSDIISMLVNVFGNKELFVNEYRTLLADRLLSPTNCNTEKEIRYLEHLKLRFGESQLHYCEVMLKDICDSKRINAHLQQDADYMNEEKKFPSTAVILSAQFWPAFKEETLELLPDVKEQLALYTKAFEMLKGNRTLCWKPHLGSVDIEIELKNKTLNLTVSPLLATIIMHFQDKEKWTIDELCHVMKVPPTMLKRKITFWLSQGIIKEEPHNTFVLVEEGTSRSKETPLTEIACEDDEVESAMASAHDQRKEELQMFWSYIVGMLTNLDSMPLDRIHQMLKMFASEGPTAMECSLQELRHFLDSKVKEHKLLLCGGIYRLPKS